jgi:flavin reductase (DIM6/NTAB) family NADH-FMN oxidoreductase RutF
MTSDKDFFRRVMGQFATGVTIATTRSQAGIAGLTVNSFTSISLNPLLVMICVDLHSQALPFFRESGIFAVNILTQEQEALSNCFATSSDERYNSFCHADYYQAATGSPILTGTMGFIDARITAEYPGGDHAIFLGEVEAMGYNDQKVFLQDVHRDWRTLLPTADAALSASNHGQEEQAETLPLLYYNGEYHHLTKKYHHKHPDLAT